MSYANNPDIGNMRNLRVNLTAMDGTTILLTGNAPGFTSFAADYFTVQNSLPVKLNILHMLPVALVKPNKNNRINTGTTHVLIDSSRDMINGT